MSSIPILGYWISRGFAQPTRYLLHYVGAPFIDKQYPFGPGVSFAAIKSIKTPWIPDRKKLNLDFPNPPYFIDGDLKLTQNITILRYVARKYGMIATKDPVLARQELAEQQIFDMRAIFLSLIAFPDYEKKKPAYIKEQLIPQLRAFEKFLGPNEWLTPELSYADCLSYEVLDFFRIFSPESFEKFPNLGMYLKRFESLPVIKEYQNSDEFKSLPLTGPVYYWGYP